jgi:choline-sulfatase
MPLTRRDFLASTAVTPAVAAAQSAPAAASKPSGKPPHILFIMVDQMTPFMTSVYGQKAAITPNLDRLAQRGMVFDNAYCNAPLCVPSRMSMFAGRLPNNIEVWDNASEFKAETPTFAHYLRRAGYHTAVSGKVHFIGPDQYHGLDERLTPCIYPTHFTFMHPWSKGPYWIQGTSIQVGLAKPGVSETNGQLVFDDLTFSRAMDKLRDHALTAKDRPLFLNVSFTQPHDPYCAPKRLLDRYRDVPIPMPKPHDDIRKLSPTYEWVRIVHGLDRETPSPEKVRECRRSYLAMCTWLDEKVGLLMGELERLGMADNTMVVFASDHGDMVGEKGQWFKRIYLEWSARIPLIVSWPGRVAAGKRSSALVSLVDLLPTFAEAAGIAVTTPVDGRSLLPLMDGREDGRDREVIGDYCGEATIEPVRMVRRGDYKYIATNANPPQLFDLKKDPDENVNVAGRREYADAEKALHARAVRDWDGPAIRRKVMASHADRDFMRGIPGYLNNQLWKPNVAMPPYPDDYGWKG